MGIDSTNLQYDEMKDEWALTRACVVGYRALKKLKTNVLPAPGADPVAGTYDKYRYASYLTRAIYTNVTGRTAVGLKGAAFREKAEIDLPSAVDYMNDNFDGAGQSIEQFAKGSFMDVLSTGRDGYLADYPQVEEGLTAEQVTKLDLKASVKRYKAEDIFDWTTEIIGGKEVLTFVKLQESYDDSADEFDKDEKIQYRVLRLRNGIYTQQVYRDGAAVTDELEPKQANKQTFPFIPFFFIGAKNNNPDVDDIPLADIAYVNVGHFRNSADLEENCHQHGQLTLGVATSIDYEGFKEANPNGITVGAMAGHYLGDGGSFTSVQADPNQLADKLQERKEGQMLALGARLVEQRNPNETAAAAKIDATGENSVLGDIVTNIEEGLRRMVEWCGMFMVPGGISEFTLNLNRKFFDDTIDPQLIIATMQGYDRSIFGKAEVRYVSRKAGIISPERTDEDIDNDVGSASPLD